jgi:hypothetical protein
MITPGLLIDVVRRFVLLEDEPIVWSKEWPDGPQVAIETPYRMYSIRVARDHLLVGRAPWVEAVVVATRDDPELCAMYWHTFLVESDGTMVNLDDRPSVAMLGTRLHRGELDVQAYAELLVECQWPGRVKRLVLDPVAWRAEYPAEARVPRVEAIQTSRVDGELLIRFFSSKEPAPKILDVAAWSVRVHADRPAVWEIQPVAEGITLLPRRVS